MARSYIKRNTTYWQSHSHAGAPPPPPAPVASVTPAPSMEVMGEAAFDGHPHYSARAACGGGSVTNQYRDGTAATGILTDRYANIRSGIVPYALAPGGYYGVSEVINLCYTAFYNFALLRNAVKLLRDFSTSRIHVKTTNLRVKTFIETWLNTIGVWDFMNQYFLEYYRGGNVFIYKFSGRIDEDGLNMLKRSYGAAPKSKIVPIRYTILNPMQVYLQLGATSPFGYVRMLSTYEIQRLKNPQTEEDLQVLQSFPLAIQKQIKTTGTTPYLYVPLDPKRLFTVFYDKMDYEPLAIPMAFPVLNDIEYKLELRRVDMALASTIERVILLVTTGRAATQWEQTPPKSNLQNLQDIFRNQTIGRVLVADYTTKAEWIVPDFKELLGPAKYEQVDKDIKEGLQYMFFGDEKFANGSIKAKIFIESLKEGRRMFLDNFLVPEVKKVCEAMGFRHVPTLEFETIQMQDEALMARLYVQMAQLGLLTDAELNEALTTGLLPTKEQSLQNQEAYKAERDKGLYAPIAPDKGDEESGSSVNKGRPAGSGGTPATRKVATPIGQRKVRAGLTASIARASERDSSNEDDILRDTRYSFGVTRIAENLVCMNGLRAAVTEALAKKWKVKPDALGDEERSVATAMAQSIILNEDGGQDGKDWLKSIPAYLKKPKEIPETVAKELTEIRLAFDTPKNPVDNWLASVLYRSQVESPVKE